jgi:NitT/TauT family transport system ATP-binding protein
MTDRPDKPEAPEASQAASGDEQAAEQATTDAQFDGQTAEKATADAQAAKQVSVDAPTSDKPEVLPVVVEFKKVKKTFNPGRKNAYTAINDVTFKVDDLPDMGEFITVVGPSGCGKSTILRLIAGLGPHHPATEGDVLVFGKPVEGPGADRGMVFQTYTSLDNRTVLNNVAFGLECRGVSRGFRHEQARHWIHRVGLSIANDQHKYPHELSGGMRQRVAIARTLILKPRIILMDEPFGALDPTTRLHMQDLLIGLWREVEATVFFVTHDITEAVYLGDRCFVLSGAPGTLLKTLQVPRPDRPAAQMQRETGFQEMVYELRDTIEQLEEGKD